MITCSLHTRTPAGWTCTGCHRTLCPECAGWRGTRSGRIELCMRCGAMAQRLRAHRSVQEPFSSTLPGALFWPLSAGGLVTLCAVALVVHILKLSGSLGAAIGYGVALAYFFQITRHTAAGHDDVPAPDDFRGLYDDVVAPGLRALIASLWFALPLGIWFFAGGHRLHELTNAETPLLLTPIALALFFSGALFYPMAIIAGALGSPLSTLLNPFAIVGLSIQLRGDYWLCAIFCLASSLCGVLLDKLCGRAFHAIPQPLGGFFTAVISLYLPFVSFRAMGLLVRARGDALGYGSPDSYRVPVLEAEPLHEVRPQEERLEATAPRSLAPIELSPLLHAIEIQNPAESAAELGAPIPLLPLEDQRDHYEKKSPRSVDLPAPPDPRLPSRLAQKMAARDLDGARSVMREGGDAIPAGTLSAQSWSDLSRAFSEDAARAEGDGKRALAELALLACKRGVEVAPDGALAPRAWLAAARISDEMLGDRAGSDRMLSQLAQKFPSTPEGIFALKRLGSQKNQ